MMFISVCRDIGRIYFVDEVEDEHMRKVESAEDEHNMKMCMLLSDCFIENLRYVIYR